MNRLRELYKTKIQNDLKNELKLSNVMEVPKLKKIVINSGIGEIRESREAHENFAEELAQITGQKASPRKARKSESGFKIRQGALVGYTVTLRGESMWAFLDKLVNIALPRVRDFKGLNLKSFDERGNYSLGIREHTIFPEINPNKVKSARGLQVTLSIDAQKEEHSKALLEKLGVPFRKGK